MRRALTMLVGVALLLSGFGGQALGAGGMYRVQVCAETGDTLSTATWNGQATVTGLTITLVDSNGALLDYSNVSPGIAAGTYGFLSSVDPTNVAYVVTTFSFDSGGVTRVMRNGAGRWRACPA
jgi:hypothetical protein